MQTNFNTSHVTVYPNSCSKSNQSIQFQYISCYCLSGTDTREFQGNVKFQYISCYCLSARTVICFAVFCISIHLMLLFIGDPAVERIQEALFQYILCYCLSDGARGVKLFIQISIHLMLLFILSGSRFRPTHV